ncbi:MAG: NarK/NasA family nitrate transporter [Candidatus Omnitrophica bacterium]|nr:NarK/NasA family nitrate transporter [Candidatus Omnitrophota bacterium]
MTDRRTHFVKSGHLPTLLLAFLYFAISMMVWVLLGGLSVDIGDDFGLTVSRRGLLVATPMLSGSLVRVPLGVLVDRIGPKRTGLVAQLIVLILLAWAWLCADRLSEVITLAFLLGIAGGSFAVALPLASRWYPPQHQGLAMGIVGAGNSGTVLAVLLAPRLAERVGWHNVFGWALLPLLVTLAFYIAFAKESPSQSAPKPLRAYLGLCRERDTLWFCLFYGFTFGGFVGLASFLLIFFHDQYRLATVTAGNFTALCVFAGSFLRPVGGYLADRLGGTRMLAVVFLAASLGLWAVALLPPLWLATVLLCTVLSLLGLGNGAMFQLVPQRFRREIGVATGVVGAAGGLGGFLLPAFLGLSRDFARSYSAGFFCVGLVGFACLLLLRVAQRDWKTLWLTKTLDAIRLSPQALEFSGAQEST